MRVLAALLLALLTPGTDRSATPTPCASEAGPPEITLPAGTRLRAAPDASATSLAVLDAEVTLPVASRCGSYAEVRWQGVRGWASPGDEKGPELERAARDADPARIARARTAMRPLGHDTFLGPWRVVTDVGMHQLDGFDAIATQLPAAYRARYGLDARPGNSQAVAIFASTSRYDAFAKEDGSPMIGMRGHAGAGLAAFAMGRNPVESRVLLVHELTHLLSRSPFGDAPPAWLDEGIAEDLAWCRVDDAGRLQPDTLDVFTARRANIAEVSGPRVTVEGWREQAARGRVFPLAALLAPGGRLFTSSSARRDAATESALLVRFCLDAPERAEKFREFLTAVSLGGKTDEAALAAALGLDSETLSKNFFEWVSRRRAVP